MGISDTVIQIVKQWASMGRDPLGTESLKVLWAASNPPGPFQPDAAQDLADQINKKFGTSLKAADFDPGSIKTVNNLIKAVTQG
jgi:hypothetical protein